MTDLVTLDELHRIISEMEDIQTHGEKPYDPRMPEAIAKLSKWNREWAAQNEEVTCCPRCGEHWPKSYTSYVHVCLMENYDFHSPSSAE